MNTAVSTKFILQQDAKRLVPDTICTAPDIITYKKSNGTYKNGKTMENILYRLKKDTADEWTNVLIEGVKLGDARGGKAQQTMGGVVQILDPRGFQMTLPFDTIIDLVKVAGYNPETGFIKPLVYTWYDNDFIPCPATQEELSQYKKDINQEVEVTLSKLIPGKYYRHKTTPGYYLGTTYLPELDPNVVKIPNDAYNYYRSSIERQTLSLHRCKFIKYHVLYEPTREYSPYIKIASSASKFIEEPTIPALGSDKVNEYYLNAHTHQVRNMTLTSVQTDLKILKFAMFEKSNVESKPGEYTDNFIGISPNRQIVMKVTNISGQSGTRKTIRMFEIMPDGNFAEYWCEFDPGKPWTNINDLQEAFPHFTFYTYTPERKIYCEDCQGRQYYFRLVNMY